MATLSLVYILARSSIAMVPDWNTKKYLRQVAQCKRFGAATCRATLPARSWERGRT